MRLAGRGLIRCGRLFDTANEPRGAIWHCAAPSPSTLAFGFPLFGALRKYKPIFCESQPSYLVLKVERYVSLPDTLFGFMDELL
jgi:hypothetical protein